MGLALRGVCFGLGLVSGLALFGFSFVFLGSEPVSELDPWAQAPTSAIPGPVSDPASWARKRLDVFKA